MSCFGGAGVATASYYSSSSTKGTTMRGRTTSSRPWRWWRAKCAGIAASVGSRLRRSIKQGLDGGGRRLRRRRATFSSVVHHHRRRQHSSFAPVYVDELYAHHQQQPSGKPVVIKLNGAAADTVREDQPSTSVDKLMVAADANRASVDVKATTATAGAARAGSETRAATAAAAGVGAMKNILMRSPGRGGGVLGVVKGMGEVDLRAELFIRKFKEDMRLQSQRSAEEFQAMLARGL